MNVDHAATIRSCPLFGAVRRDLLERIADAAIERHMGPHRTLVSQGEPFHYLGIVVEGSIVATATSAEGRERILYEAKPIDTFGVIPLLDEGGTVARIAAGEHGATLLLIPKHAVDLACRSDAALSFRFARAAAHRARTLTQSLSDLAFASTAARTARALLSFLPVQPADVSMTGWVEAPLELRCLSQAHLARLVGTVRVVAARVLHALAVGNGIILERGRVVRINAAVLAHWVQPR